MNAGRLAKTSDDWFEVDRDGLLAQLDRKGRAWALFELVQNGWDAPKVSRVSVTLQPSARKGYADIVVEDDAPDGFLDLRLAFTLFAKSNKIDDPEKRGQFCIGEKLVIALCDTAEIKTTKGTVTFGKDGRTINTRQKSEAGTTFRATIRLNADQLVECDRGMRSLIPPPEVVTTYNGEQIQPRVPIDTFDATLPTTGSAGQYDRKTVVSLYEPLGDEEAMLYEMGLPVLKTGDKYHYGIAQKVPVNWDRDNVPPRFMHRVRTIVLNRQHANVPVTEAAEGWVRDALSDTSGLLTPDAASDMFTKRFGQGAVAADASDTEANKRAAGQGRTVVHGGSLSSAEWANARMANMLLPAGKVTPSPKPYGPNAVKKERIVPPGKWTLGMRHIAKYATRVAAAVLEGKAIDVQYVNDVTWPFLATYGPDGGLTFNVAKLGHAFFNGGVTVAVDDLLIHEFGHQYCGDHLDERYHEALTLIGARLKHAKVPEDVPGDRD